MRDSNRAATSGEREPNDREARERDVEERDRGELDRHIEAALALARTLPESLRAEVEAIARDRLRCDDHMPRTAARDSALFAFSSFDIARTERMTREVIGRSIAARAPAYLELLTELREMKPEERAKMHREAARRVNDYPASLTGLDDIRLDSAAARVKDVLAPTPHTKREALILADAREQMECAADPHRLEWRKTADDLAMALS